MMLTITRTYSTKKLIKNIFLGLIFSLTYFLIIKLPDGANAIVVGNLGSIQQPVALVGGNCSILALDKTGEEVMWTVSVEKWQKMA